MNDVETERLEQWWSTLSADQRAEVKAAAASGNYPDWLIDDLTARVFFGPQVEAWWAVDEPSSRIKAMRPDLVEWLAAQPEDSA